MLEVVLFGDIERLAIVLSRHSDLLDIDAETTDLVVAVRKNVLIQILRPQPES